MITSHQRRANDKRRFWSGYPAMVARRAAEKGTGHHFADALIEAHGEVMLRALYRAEVEYDRLKARFRHAARPLDTANPEEH